MSRRNGNSAGGGVTVLAAIERQVHVRLVDISRKGCMFECDCALETGTVGTLTVAVGTLGEFEDVVQVQRVQPVAGRGALYHVGAEFIWTEAPGDRSLRHLGHKLPATVSQPTGVVRLRRGA